MSRAPSISSAIYSTMANIGSGLVGGLQEQREVRLVTGAASLTYHGIRAFTPVSVRNYFASLVDFRSAAQRELEDRVQWERDSMAVIHFAEARQTGDDKKAREEAAAIEAKAAEAKRAQEAQAAEDKRVQEEAAAKKAQEEAAAKEAKAAADKKAQEEAAAKEARAAEARKEQEATLAKEAKAAADKKAQEEAAAKNQKIIDDLKKELTSAQKSEGSLKDQLSNQSLTLAELLKTKESLQSQATASQQEKTNLQAQLDQAKNNAAAAATKDQQTISRLREGVRLANERVADLEEQIRESRGSLAELQEQQLIAQRQQLALQASLQQVIQQVAQMNG